MTCIVAISHDDTVYMAGDRGHSDNDIIVPSLAPKIFNKTFYLFGYAGNTGLGQLVAYNFDAPTIRVNTDTYRYMYQFFIPALRDHLKDYLSDKEDYQASFIIGIRGKVFEIDTADFQCIEYKEVAIGSGAAYAYGVLYATDMYSHDNQNYCSPSGRVQMAIESACKYSPTCSGPIDLLHL